MLLDGQPILAGVPCGDISVLELIYRMVCPSCHNPNPEGARFCMHCGMARELACPSCGATITAAQNYCAMCGGALEWANPPPADVDEGERRHATIVFSDLSGYTALNEQMDPEDVESIMGEVRRAASSIIQNHGGVVNQFVGDEIVALYGVPIARRDDAIRAVRAALEIHAAVREIGSRIGAQIGRALCMHTGINTGLAIVRRGDGRAGQYLLTGDMVNTAARLLSLAKDDEIVVGQETWREVSGTYDATPSPPTAVKGKELPIVPWRIQGPRSAKPEKERPLIGRDREIGVFQSMARNCWETGRGAVIVLRGEPGIGKSRLAAEFGSRASATGFLTFTSLVLDFSADGGRNAICEMARSLNAAIPLTELAPEKEVFLCDLLELSLRPELRMLGAAMDEDTRNLGTRDVLRELVTRASAHSPLMLVVEDVHWANPWTLERLAVLAYAATAGRTLLVMTTRPNIDHPSGITADIGQMVIDLQPLSIDDSTLVANSHLTMPPDAVRAVVQRAAGNPLFIEQLMLGVGQYPDQALPGSIQALVLARMDRLPKQDRLLLQAASVLGQKFSLEAVNHLIGSNEQDVGELLAHQLVKPAGDQYLFGHALIRDGVYESLLKSRRRRLHTRAGEWYESRDPAYAASHYDRAGDPRAARTYLEAAEAEALRHHYEQAVELLVRGLEVTTSREESFNLNSAKARMLLEAGRARDSLEAWEKALQYSSDGVSRCRCLLGVAACMRVLDRTADGLAALQQAEPLALAGGLSLEQSRLYNLRGNLYFGQGRAEECLREHEMALKAARESQSAEAEANALSGLGDAYYIRGRMRSANTQFAHCVALARDHGLGRIEVANMHMMGWTSHYLDILSAALESADRSVALASAVAHRRVEILGRSLGAYVGGWLMGIEEPARRNLEIALPLAQRLGSRRFEGQARTYMAMIELRFGDRDRARCLAFEALDFCRIHGMEFFGPVVLGLAARLADDPKESANLNAEAIEMLGRGAISHNYFEFSALAIDGALERHALDEVEQYCALLEAYTATEPLPWSDIVIRRGRALASFERGDHSEGRIADLIGLRSSAAEREFDVALPALDAALEQVRHAVRPD